jgi:hypothetical protein
MDDDDATVDKDNTHQTTGMIGGGGGDNNGQNISKSALQVEKNYDDRQGQGIWAS